MKAGVLCNGRVEDYRWLQSVIAGLDLLICADGGANHAFKAGVVPKLIIGDLDSVLPEVLEHFNYLGVRVKKFPPEKDQTDQQLALAEALEYGATEIFLLGSAGCRLDHTLGSLSVLAGLHAKGVKACLLDEYNEISLWEKEAVIEGQVGEEVSLLPYTPKVTGISTENLRYPLRQGTFEFGNPYGISNVLTAARARVSFEQGLLLVIKSRDTLAATGKY